MFDDKPSYFESIKRWFNTNVTGSMGETTNVIAKGLAESDYVDITETSAKNVTPLAAGLVATGAGVAAMPALEKVGSYLFGGIKQVVTGFGYFPKIPVLGGAFKLAGAAVDKVGEYSGLLLVGVGSVLSYSMFKAKPSEPQIDPRNTPNEGTGAVGQEPLNARFVVTAPEKPHVGLAEANGPVEPQPVAISDDVKKLLDEKPELKDAKPEKLRQERVAAIGAGMESYSDSIRGLMQQENQEYENRRLFLYRVEQFATKENPATGKIPREHLIDTLSSKQVGLSAEEAESLVPKPPALRYTVTHGKNTSTNSVDADNKPTDFSGQYATLEQFAKKFEGFYGLGFVKVSERSESGRTRAVPKAYKEMSVTQKHEFLESALEHCRTNHAWFEEHCTTRKTSRRRRVSVTTTSYDYRPLDTRGIFDYFSGARGSETYRTSSGAPKEVSWKDEHEFLRKLNKDIGVSVQVRGGINEKSRGSGLSRTSGNLGKWQTLLDGHKEELEEAAEGDGGSIKRYTTAIMLMKHSMGMIGDHGVAVLDYNRYLDRKNTSSPEHNLRHYLEIRDLRDSDGTPKDSEKFRLEGSWDTPSEYKDFNFTVRAISDTGTGENRKELITPISINMETGENVDTLLEAIDAAKGLKAAQTSQSMPDHIKQQISKLAMTNHLQVKDDGAEFGVQTGSNIPASLTDRKDDTQRLT